MKKNILVLLMLLLTAGSLHAQTFDELFKQKKTHRKYQLQQIAALQVYIGYARKGYKIAKQGLATIGGITRGELTLHDDHFQSLRTVNPEIRNNAKVAGIIAYQVKILRNYNSTYKRLRNSNAFSKEELAYISSVFANLLEDCEKTLDELIAVTTNGKLEMKDDERLARIDKLYVEMQDKFTFCNSFGNDAGVLAASRLKAQSDIQSSRALLGIKK